MERSKDRLEKVVIVGGGVAGLTAAHELVEKGFRVEIYERRPFFGGKAASYRVVPGQDPDATELGRPGEHGFRFFPGWYRHLIDTLERIPYHEDGGGRRTVAENLVSVGSNLLAWFDRASVELPVRVPRSLDEAAITSQFVATFGRFGLNAGESALFTRKLAEMLFTTEERRLELEAQSWWDYLECSHPGRSRAYQDLVRASTRTSVAAKAEQVSAFTVGRLVVRTLVDTLSSTDRVLNGPTNEVWIEPWVTYLKSRGVVFKQGMELSAIALDRKSCKVAHLVLDSVVAAHLRRLQRFGPEESVEERRLLNQVASAFDADHPQKALGDELRNVLATARKAAAETQKAADDAERDEHGKETDESQKARAAAKADRDRDLSVMIDKLLISGAWNLTERVEADYFILALPLEQLAYYVNRSTMITHLAPELRRVVPLAREMDWMAGIQFYLATNFDVAMGHIVGVDSDWSLTAVEQTQFWDDVALPKDVKAVLSVDIAAWDRKGRTVRKEAFNCDDEEIATEVWSQLKEMLNRPNRSPVLQDSMLVAGSLKRGTSYHVDTSLIDLRDRKKEAFYERARGVHFGAFDESWNEEAADKVIEDYMWGPPSRRFNSEPLLINRAGTRRLRPDACTSVPNLFIAGDYVRTETDLACMEGANEAARLAVNGVLDAARSREDRCALWPFSPSRQAVEAVLGMAAPTRVVQGISSTVSSLRDRFWRSFVGG